MPKDKIKDCIKEALCKNDVGYIAEILGGYGFHKESIPKEIGLRELRMLMYILTCASTHKTKLGVDMVTELIARASLVIDCCSFLEYMLDLDSIGEVKGNEIVPEWIRDAMSKYEFSSKIADEIEKMDTETFLAFASFMLSAEKGCLNRFMLSSIVRRTYRVYEEKKISNVDVFIHMALCLDTPRYVEKKSDACFLCLS